MEVIHHTLLDTHQVLFQRLGGPLDPNDKKLTDITFSADGLPVSFRESRVILALFKSLIEILDNPELFNAPEDQARIKEVVKARFEQWKSRFGYYVQTTLGRFNTAGRSTRVV